MTFMVVGLSFCDRRILTFLSGLSDMRAEAGALLFESDIIAENKMRNCRLTRAGQDKSLSLRIKAE